MCLNRWSCINEWRHKTIVSFSLLRRILQSNQSRMSITLLSRYSRMLVQIDKISYFSSKVFYDHGIVNNNQKHLIKDSRNFTKFERLLFYFMRNHFESEKSVHALLIWPSDSSLLVYFSSFAICFFLSLSQNLFLCVFTLSSYFSFSLSCSSFLSPSPTTNTASFSTIERVFCQVHNILKKQSLLHLIAGVVSKYESEGKKKQSTRKGKRWCFGSGSQSMEHWRRNSHTRCYLGRALSIHWQGSCFHVEGFVDSLTMYVVVLMSKALSIYLQGSFFCFWERCQYINKTLVSLSKTHPKTSF